MATPNGPKREHPSTYFVQDRSSEEEMNRLSAQDQLFTASMGGVLPEQPDPSRFQRILDVGCGTGGWSLEAAQKYPHISLFGVDISGRMVEYARAQAAAQGLSARTEFRVMDALRMLEFPDNFFDLVNIRLSVGWLRKWDWPRMLSELQRVTRPGGVIRVTEGEIINPSTSPALTQWFEMMQCALFRAGHLFAPESNGITAHLAPLFAQHGLQDIQTRPYAIEYHGDTPEGQAYADDWKHAFRTLQPFLQKWGCTPQDYREVSKQAVEEMQRSDFHAFLHLFTAYGCVAPDKK